MKSVSIVLCLMIGLIFVGSPLSLNAATIQKKKGGTRYRLGPKGGCYYLAKNGNKVYVNRSRCHRG